jgi:peptidylprolyl isomerase
MKITLSAILFAAAAPLAAQTAAPKPPVHHVTPGTSAMHHATTATHCSVALPVMSSKIPALPVAAPKCPSIEYQLTYIDTKIGEGELATSKKYYTVHYTGYLPDGTKFDSSVDRGEPITFPYGAHRVITGWDTGFEGMRVGGKRRLFIPYELAYGEDGHPPVIPAKSTLIFDVEFIAQNTTPPVPKTPPAAPQPAASPAGSAPAPAAAPVPAAKPTTSEPAPGAEPKTTPAPAPSGAPTSTPPSTPKQ